jgi:hypothetical protein
LQAVFTAKMTTGVNLRCSNAATSVVGNAVVFVHPVGPFMFGIVPRITFSNMMLRALCPAACDVVRGRAWPRNLIDAIVMAT